jgi:hypothetical protein
MISGLVADANDKKAQLLAHIIGASKVERSLIGEGGHTCHYLLTGIASGSITKEKVQIHTQAVFKGKAFAAKEDSFAFDPVTARYVPLDSYRIVARRHTWTDRICGVLLRLSVIACIILAILFAAEGGFLGWHLQALTRLCYSLSRLLLRHPLENGEIVWEYAHKMLRTMWFSIS